MKNRRHGLAWGLLVWVLIAAPWLVLGLVTASRLAATMDEVPHFGAGLSYLEYGDFRMNPEHPPLVKMLAMLPVWLVARPDMSGANDPMLGACWLGSWQHIYGHQLIYYPPDGHHQTRLFLARLVPLLIGLGGGLLAFVWGREIAGNNPGGWAAATLLMYYPEYLGHSGFVTFDVPMLVACAGISWAAWQWWRRPTWDRLAIFAATCAVGSLVKLPVAMFAAMQCGVLLVLAAFDERRGQLGRVVVLVLATMLAGYAACWAIVGFRFSAVAPGQRIDQLSLFLGPLDHQSPSALVRVLARVHDLKLLPETSIAVLDHLTAFSDRYQMLFGRSSHGGWWYYFLVTTLLKTPLPMLIGLAILVVLGGRRLHSANASRTRRWRAARAAILVVPFVLLGLMVMRSGVNIGHRHFLAVYFPWCVFLGVVVARGIASSHRWHRWMAAGMLASQVLTTLWVFPHQATYINLIGGSPYRASTILTDSNIDWGQDLPALGEWMRDHGIERVNLAYFGSNRPASYGVRSYRWIIHADSTFIGEKDDMPPDLRLPTAISLFNLPFCRKGYPELYGREPDVILNSIVIFEPELTLE